MMASALYAGYPQTVFATANEVQAVMQSGIVKGQVVDENGEAIIGATVMMNGTSNELLLTSAVTSHWKMLLKAHW